MALDIRFSYRRSSDNYSIIITDETGAYDATSNPTGYGGINPAIADFTTFEIAIYSPDSTTLMPGTTSVTVDAFPTFPSNSGAEYTVTSLALLGTADTTIPDGVYKFVAAADYDTGVEEGTGTNSQPYWPFYEIVDCCITNMIVEMRGCNCNPNSSKVKKRNQAIADLFLLRPYSFNGEMVDSPVVQCEQWTLAADLIGDLQDICDADGCTGCRGCQ